MKKAHFSLRNINRNRTPHIDHYKNIGKTGSSPDRYNPLLPMPEAGLNFTVRANISVKNTIDKFIIPITLDELLPIIKDLPINKAAGPSNISYEIIKHLPSNFLIIIVDLFNAILQHGYIPSQ
ncbi:uncharacterized protein OCT59_001384 [Rhizophagus irregularis]|uniref:uncharacterized protein n=1 Tax=Rhizophagus irregularis TaxID=588596 RepID=UPI0019F762EB|nr:hypothetical protein OCT59_001384 [Rhizophagus irregularis]GET61273.1 hypothetical protein GLOIN_2v149057 [Rhizophagus irregularis DAOM 181602=DAOM 197198]